jgi:hypothetical protein
MWARNTAHAYQGMLAFGLARRNIREIREAPETQVVGLPKWGAVR